jgi:hypothetical protein
MLARRVNKQVPSFFVDKDRCPVVKQIPTNEIKVFATGRFVDRQRKIVAALGGAVIAKVFALGKVRTSADAGGSGCRGH